MNEQEIKAALAGLPLGGLRFYASIGSTNDEALDWAPRGARDLSLVVADEQTAGRGRAGRKWHTPPGTALALSIVLRPMPMERDMPARLTGLAALALVQCCRGLGLEAQIKWPNDVLLGGRKAAGILVESTWAGNRLEASVIGVGVNVSAAAVPPAAELSFPATSIEDELHRSVDRLKLLHEVLQALISWRSQADTPKFIEAWEEALAFRGEQVTVARDGEAPLSGKLVGLEADGSLRLQVNGNLMPIRFGEVSLRPGDARIGSVPGGPYV